MAAASAYFVGVVVAVRVGNGAGEYARDVWRWQAPPPAFGVGWAWDFTVLIVGLFGPLAAFVAAAVRGWPWWRAAVVPSTVGLVAAAAVLLTTDWGDRLGSAAVVAHLGLSAGMVGGALAGVRARCGRPLDADAAVGDDDP